MPVQQKQVERVKENCENRAKENRQQKTIKQTHIEQVGYLGFLKCILGLLEGIAITGLARLILQLLDRLLKLFVLFDLLLQCLDKLAERTLGLVSGGDQGCADMTTGWVGGQPL